MIARTTAVTAIPALAHEEAMDLAEAEWARVLALVDALDTDDWAQQTDCPRWDVKAMLGHMLGMLELQADPADRVRQISAAAEVAGRTGCLRLDAMTAQQVKEHETLTPDELRKALHAAAPRGIAARRATTAEQRATPYLPELPGEGAWTVGYLFDVIHTRDPWIHRVDICRATGREMVITAEHDGRLVADVVADWAARHGQPFALTLTGPAGGSFSSGQGGDPLELDAVEFCRVLSGRARGSGLLATHVAF
jgi:uncharacterized protein (TIGR03083 family)